MTDLERGVERLEQELGISDEPRVILHDHGSLRKTVRVSEIESVKPNEGTHPMLVELEGSGQYFVSRIEEADDD